MTTPHPRKSDDSAPVVAPDAEVAGRQNASPDVPVTGRRVRHVRHVSGTPGSGFLSDPRVVRIQQWVRTHTPVWLKPFVAAVVDTVQRYTADRCSTLAAGLAFFGLLSLAPTAMFVVAIASVFVSRDSVQQSLIQLAQQWGGAGPAAEFGAILQSASAPVIDSATAVIAVIVLAFGAARVFQHLHASLNLVFDVEPARIKFGRAALRLGYRRLVTFGLLLLMALLMLVTVVANAILGALIHRLSTVLELPGAVYLVQPASLLLSLVVGTAMIAVMYQTLPDVRLPWKQTLIASASVSLVFAIGKLGLETYVGMIGVESSFGAAGSLVVLMLWMYFSFSLLLAGAELCVTLIHAAGGEVTAERWAHKVERLPAVRSNQNSTVVVPAGNSAEPS
jgi:membrane protein